MSQILTFQISTTERLSSCGWDPSDPGESNRTAQHGWLLIEGGNWECPKGTLASKGHKGLQTGVCLLGSSQRKGSPHTVGLHCFTWRYF